MDKKINPEMIRIARESRGLTQSNLATLISTAQGNVSKIEIGLLGVSEETLRKISDALNYPEGFFYFQDPIYGLGISGMGILYHRKRQSVPNKIIDKIHAQINVRDFHLERFLRSIKLKNNSFPPFDIDDYNGDAEEIARLARANWLLPKGPINNLTKVIEDAGGIVIEFDFETKAIDAISQFLTGLPPLFFINRNIPGDRLRFSIAHELGHILMHRTCNSGLKKMESEADKFAAEFLVPRAEISSSLYALELSKLVNLKLHWKVSMAMILRTAHNLGKITDSQYQYLWIQMGRAGYKTKEPVDIPKEEPTILREIINAHRHNLDFSTKELCKLLELNEQEFNTIYSESKSSHLRLVR